MELLERIPEAGDTVDYRNMHLTVESMKEKRVDTVSWKSAPKARVHSEKRKEEAAIMMTELEQYYNKFNEEKRLDSRHGKSSLLRP